MKLFGSARRFSCVLSCQPPNVDLYHMCQLVNILSISEDLYHHFNSHVIQFIRFTPILGVFPEIFHKKSKQLLSRPNASEIWNSCE